MMTVDDIKSLAGDMRDYYADLFKNLREDDDYYDLDFADLLRLPRKYRRDAVILPTARSVVDTAVDHITPTFRRISVPRRAATVQGTEQAQKLQRFYEALLTWLERLSAASPYRMAAKHLTLYGLSVVKLIYDSSMVLPEPTRADYANEDEYNTARTEWREAKAENIPFRLMVLHPSEVYIDPFHDPPEWGIQEYERYVHDVQRHYPTWQNPHNRRGAEKVNVIEYWDNCCRCVLVDDEPALIGQDGAGVVEHPWGTHPYIIASSGYGLDDAEHRPQAQYVGMLRYLRQILISESRSFSIADIVLKASAWPVRIAEGERANEMPPLRLEYGEVQPMPPGVKLTELTPQLPPQMLFSFMAVVNNIISETAAPRAVQGLHQPGLTSGFDRQLALGQARLRYGSLADGMDKILTELCRKAGIIIEGLRAGPINIAAAATQDEFMSVSWRDFRGHHAVQVKINVLEPEDEIRKHQDAISLVAGGLMSPQTAIRKYFPDVDPESEIGRIIAARLLFAEPVLTLLGQLALREAAGKLGLEEAIGQILSATEARQQQRRPAPPQAPPPEEGAGSRQEQAAMRVLDLRERGI